jgi:phosphotransferase system  glucose/maltose/N-acetylglucosamine-specific IIC component
MENKKLYYLYAILALIGLLATWYFNIRYMLSGGSFAPGPFWHHAFANQLTAGITLDVYIAAIAFAIWVFPESKNLGIKRPWLYVALCFFGALAFALPLFLAVRIHAMQKVAIRASTNHNGAGQTTMPCK